MKKQNKPDLPVLSFSSQLEWNQWLTQNHTLDSGIWLRFFKKGSNIKSVVYDEALDEALCFGWIDGQLKKYDEQSYLQRFTPRRPKSIWSKRNIGNVTRLENEGRLKPSGIKEIEAAKADGRWEAAYVSPSEMTIPDDFLKELVKNKEAFLFYESLNKTNKYAIAWQLQTAKRPETREKRMKQILEMMAKKEKLH